MNRLGDLIAARIRAEGPLTLADFMAEALAHGEFGYYRRADPLGRFGDFITAPEISQVFGELIGLWLVACWSEGLGRPDPFNLVELGPGRGTLMMDALRAAAIRPAFGAAARLHLVEINQSLIGRQHELLSAVLAPGRAPAWHETADRVPEGTFLLVANEFFDALPIRQFVREAAGWRERLVGLSPETGGLAFQPAAALAPPGLVPTAREDAPPGAIAEVAPEAAALATALAARMERAPGLALIIDYGPGAGGAGDSLQAVRGHAFADPLADPGLADLSAHVDFAALAQAARAGRARAYGPIEQGLFLRRLGIEARAARLVEAAAPAARAGIVSACRRLIDPREMGSLFKVLALASPVLPAPAGFLPEEEFTAR